MEYTKGPWYISEDQSVWQLFGEGPVSGGHPMQIIKAPKRSIEYAEYWPNSADESLIVHAPDMYLAIKACIELLEKTGQSGTTLTKLRELISKIES